MTSATERLRALLDERGVEWWEEDGHTLWYGESLHHAASAFSSFMFGESERVHLNAMVTPEQAIDATLGPGTCRDVRSEDATIAFECSECGCWVAYDEYWETGIYIRGEGQQVHIHPHYCPNCGREVVA